ncbi:MAG: HNH endonuclease [Planctomycetes bacterium]|nr:HNH endonuclease [Planctomycetota bacterium]
MCRGAKVCSVLGDRSENWSKYAPLPPPVWFDGQLDFFGDAVRNAATGDFEIARALVRTIRCAQLREWYVEHGQNSGVFRSRTIGEMPLPTGPIELDKTRMSTAVAREVFLRDGYRCRYCGIRLVDERVTSAFEAVVGRDVFCATGTNAQRHGIVLAFRAIADHVLDWKRGGRTSAENLVSACWSCNYGKSNYTLDQIGLDDPRDRPPLSANGSDGLSQYINALKKQAHHLKAKITHTKDE